MGRRRFTSSSGLILLCRIVRSKTGQGGLGLQPDAIIDRILQALLTAKITLSRLNRHVPEQELFLFELPARLMTQASASPAEVVRSNRAKAAI